MGRLENADWGIEWEIVDGMTWFRVCEWWEIKDGYDYVIIVICLLMVDLMILIGGWNLQNG